MKKIVLLIALATMAVTKIYGQSHFITTWDLGNPGFFPTQISFGVNTTGIATYSWTASPSGSIGTGTFTGANISITGLPISNVITLSISPTNFDQIFINNGPDKNRLTNVNQWGTIVWSNMQGAFAGCVNLNITASDVPNLTGVSSMMSMFYGCSTLNGPSNIGTWNTASVTTMANMFQQAIVFNQPIGTWNTVSVNYMNSMFQGASAFNQPIGTWNTVSVNYMNRMFQSASAFNQPIGTWNTAAVTDMGYMFASALVFNQPIGTWNTANVIAMSSMFQGASAFNQPIGTWNTSAVTNMSNMFSGANSFAQPVSTWNTASVTNMSKMFFQNYSFNQPISSWNTAAVTNMSNMFEQAYTFNQPIGAWNTSAVTDMSGMFLNAQSFNQPISTWNTSAVTSMQSMFRIALVFNQPIGTWNTAAVTDMNRMFESAEAFNQPIGSWNTVAVTNMKSMFKGAFAFNQPIGSWNTASVTEMDLMFYDANVFNQSIGTWNTAAVTNMNGMFVNAYSFNQPIGTWNTSAVTNMQYMFASATAFNQPIGTWNTGAVYIMSFMFDSATAFNQPIGTWNTASVNYMNGMFRSATAFNQPIGTWNTSAVTTMQNMFASATAFNQPIGTWNTTAVTDMMLMFKSATAFNQPIGTWNTTAVTNMHSMLNSAIAFNQPIGTWPLAPTVNLGFMLNGCGMDCNNYSATLIGWANNTSTPILRSLGASGLNYSSTASAAHDTLLLVKVWTITGDYVDIAPTFSVNSGLICSGNSFTIVPSGGITYSYSSGSAIVSPTVSTSYTVIGISASGCSNTAVSSITVNPTSILASASSSIICIGSSAVLSVSPSATSYSWSTGATTASVSVSPTVSASYSVMDVFGCSTAATINLIVDNTCADVWPGDANSDGVANNLDVLELGLHYAQTGPARAITSNLWQSYFSNNWIGTITGGKNLNHSDCNGDGIIDANDTLAIYNNYGLTHAFRPELTTLTDPQLSIVSDQGYVEKGKWGSSSIYLGDATAPVNTVNGVAFTLNFDNTLIETDSIYLTYLPSFIDAGSNLHFRKTEFVNNKLFTASTHTINLNVSGYGKIAILNYKIKPSLLVDAPLNISINQAYSSNISGSIIPLTTGTSSVLAVGASVGIKSYDNSGKIIIYPNPAKDVLYFETNSLKENMSIVVYNAFGQIVLKESIHSTKSKLAINSLANGVYFIDVLTNETSISKTKFVKE